MARLHCVEGRTPLAFHKRHAALSRDSREVDVAPLGSAAFLFMEVTAEAFPLVGVEQMGDFRPDVRGPPQATLSVL